MNALPFAPIPAAFTLLLLPYTARDSCDKTIRPHETRHAKHGLRYAAEVNA
jgi:hypothetical protein